MYGIDFHADDYAASIENSKRILSLARSGRIDSFSVITNMGCYEACMDLLRADWTRFPRKPLLSVHINLIDGYWLCAEKEGQIIRNSWVGLLASGMVPGRRRKRLRELLSAEIEAQIGAFLRRTEDLETEEGEPLPLRIDGHVHTHMIPLVFAALMDALERMGLRERVRFIRCSSEPLLMFLSTPGVTGTISPVNLTKNLILRVLSHSVRKKLGAAHIPTGYVFGLALTGEMDLKRVRLMMPKMKAYVRKKDARLEVLTHPGGCLPEELSEEYGPDDRKAFLAPGRDIEYRMLTERPED
ncbi:MAG: ChbG/HpnK family deacetylase [Clostridia bacterium]|nr:ChbG/HpnK family deacetylase [Clostridia bacterium]